MKTERMQVTTKLLLALVLVQGVVFALVPDPCCADDKAALNEQLIQAAGNGDLLQVEKLLDDGAEVNARTGNGRTPLMAAAASGHIHVVRLLLGSGANISAGLEDGRAALRLAKQRGHSEIVELLKAPCATETELIMHVRVAVTNLFYAVIILCVFASSTENRADRSAFFARQKWALGDAYWIVIPVIVLIFISRVLFPLRDGFIPSWSDTLMWSAVCIAIPVGYRIRIATPHGIRLVDFGIDKTHFLKSGILALNFSLGYFALLAADLSIPPLNRLATESRLFCSWLDTAIMGFGLVFCEELLFRGILYAPAARRTGKWFAIGALSLVECLIHVNLDVPQSGILFVVFVIFYLIYIRTESLLAPLILHIGIIVPLWQPMSMAAMTSYLGPETVKILYICAPLLALFIVDGWWLRNFLSRRKTDRAAKG